MSRGSRAQSTIDSSGPYLSQVGSRKKDLLGVLITENKRRHRNEVRQLWSTSIEAENKVSSSRNLFQHKTQTNFELCLENPRKIEDFNVVRNLSSDFKRSVASAKQKVSKLNQDVYQLNQQRPYSRQNETVAPKSAKNKYKDLFVYNTITCSMSRHQLRSKDSLSLLSHIISIMYRFPM